MREDDLGAPLYAVLRFVDDSHGSSADDHPRCRIAARLATHAAKPAAEEVPCFLLKASPLCCQDSSPQQFFHHRRLVGWWPGDRGLGGDSSGDGGCGILRNNDLCRSGALNVAAAAGAPVADTTDAAAAGAPALGAAAPDAAAAEAPVLGAAAPDAATAEAPELGAAAPDAATAEAPALGASAPDVAVVEAPEGAGKLTVAEAELEEDRKSLYKREAHATGIEKELGCQRDSLKKLKEWSEKRKAELDERCHGIKRMPRPPGR
ncbi:integumentary mucin C.1-like [Panicum virgatum]|uniref:integumentary mucin C.1-like n=1 Tax=Panicum virgatum TaxID=38727 RepID=UPI0019D5CE1F|nr:integumentary mucin C.1-like [Panicum virgatum]